VDFRAISSEEHQGCSERFLQFELATIVSDVEFGEPTLHPSAAFCQKRQFEK
jgi:hypothetical protein